jgi:hypothetical protein
MPEYWTIIGQSLAEYVPNCLISLASPTGFEPVLPP